MADTAALKTRLFTIFLSQYGENLYKVHAILRFLHTYPESIKELRISQLIKPDELFELQKEWVWLVSKYEGLEKEFFKPFWVPIEYDNFDHFIDLSDEAFPVFDTSFFMEEPYSYFKTIVFNSSSKFLLALERDTDFISLAEDIRDDNWHTYFQQLKARKKLIFGGKLKIKKPDYFQIFGDAPHIPFKYSFSNGYHTINCRHVSSMICGLLPFALKIELTKSTFDESDLKFLSGYDLSVITDIHILTYAIRLFCSDHMHLYRCNISPDTNEFILYVDHNFIIRTKDTDLKDQFINSFSQMLLTQ